MRFASGLAAVEFFIEKHGDYSIQNSMMQKFVEDCGHGLEYQSNGQRSRHPVWANNIDTLADIESIMRKHMTKEEIRTMFKAVLRCNDSAVNPDVSDKLTQYEILTFARFSIQLEMNGYGAPYVKDAYPVNKSKLTVH